MTELEYEKQLGLKDMEIKDKEVRITELERKLEQTEKDLADYQFNYPTIKELEKENAELRNNGFTVSAMTEQQLKVALEKGEQLEKENAELKAIVRNTKAVDESFALQTIQLTNAKEIIRELLNSCFGYNSKTVNYEVKAKAEQFLKDSEVEK